VTPPIKNPGYANEWGGDAEGRGKREGREREGEERGGGSEGRESVLFNLSCQSIHTRQLNVR